MIPNLADLQKKCAELNLLVVQKGKRPAKDDYVRVLREYYMPPGGLPYEELTPMLCFPEWDLKEDEREKIWTSPSWVAQKKLNGCRVILHFVEGVGVFAHSRTTSVKTYRYQELTESLLFKDLIPDFDATLDCEALIEKPVNTSPYTDGKGEVTKSSLHSTTAVLHLDPENGRKLQVEQDAPIIFHVLDITKWEGVDQKGKSLADRTKVLKEFKQVLHLRVNHCFRYFQFPELVGERKKQYFQDIVENGGEGVVLKNLNSPYVASSSRRRDAWIKCKKRIEFDAYVSGFKPGEPGSGWENLVGALEFSINTESGPHVLGYPTNISLELRKLMTNPGPELNPKWYGRVAQISGQDISARSLRLSHCTIDRWRTGLDQKSAEECRTSMQDLRNAAAWVG